MISKKRTALLIIYFLIALGLAVPSGSVRGARVAGEEDITSTDNRTQPQAQPQDQGRAVQSQPAAEGPSGQEQAQPEPERTGPAAVKQGRAEAGETRYVTIDFDDVDISLFIKFISELTGKNFIIDKAVRGNVTIISPTKITVDEAYKVFESVLEIHGFTTIPAGSVTKIVPALEARSKDIETRIRKEITDPTDKIVTQLIPLKFADPEEIKKVFAPFVSKSSVIVSYPPTGMLIITDVLSNIQRLLKIVNVIDVEGLGEELTVIQLEHATASVMSKSLATIFQQTRSAVRGQAKTESVVESAVKIVPDERTNSLILLASENDTAKIKALIELLDRETPRGEGDIHVYYLQNSNAEDLSKVLTSIPSATTREGGADRVQAPVVSKDVQIVADKSTNALVITAKKADYLILEDVIKKLDIPRPMVYIEALIMEVSLTKNFNIGVEWQAMDQIGTRNVKGQELAIGAFGGSRTGSPGLSTSSGLAILPSGFTLGVLGEAISIGGIQFPTISAVINAFQSDSDIHILSTPQIMTIDNEEAEIVVADNIPFLTRQERSTTGSDLDYSNYEYRDVGVTLNITPQINQERFVRLKIAQEVSEVLSQANDRPSTLKRQAKTTVIIKDGHTIVIGGLIDETLNRSRNQVPCLGSMAGIGALFRSDSDSSNRTNLFIFLTPHIIENMKEAEDVYQDKKAQIEWEKEASIKLYQGRDRYREDMRLNDRGYNHLIAGEYDKAREYFEKALKVNPENPYAILNMGVLHEKQGRTEEAIRMYEKVIQLNPKDRAGEATDTFKKGDSLVDIAKDNIRKIKGE